MGTILRSLIVEDKPEDAELVILELQRSGYEPDWRRVCTEQDFRQALNDSWDIVLSDYSMPQFDAPRALKLLRERLHDMPFIVISGTIGEDVAVDVMRLGATDYLLKDRLTRLGTAVDRALYQKRLKESVRQTEEALRTSEERFRLALDNSPICVFNQDAELRYTWIYNCAFGDTPEEVIGKTDQDVFDAESAARLFSLKSHALRSSQPVSELLEVRRGSRRSYIDLTVEPRNDFDGKVMGISGVAIDVTRLKETESERELLATAIDQAKESVVITDTSGRIKYANPGFARTTGYSPKDYEGELLETLIGVGGPDQSPSIWRRTSSEGVWQGRVEMKRKDGSKFTSDFAVSPVVDTTGQLTSFVLVGRDVTREARIEAQLIEAQKMEAIGTLAGGIAHDFNNVLSAMIGYTEFVVQQFPDNELVQRDLGTVLQAGGRAKKLIQQILTISRSHDEDRAPMHLLATVEEAREFLRASLPATIELRLEIPPDVPLVFADATQMSQVVMNLCTNAAHAMRDKPGELTIRLCDEEIGERRPTRFSALQPGRYVRLSVRDTGHGMDRKTLERIFEPFFTTKGVGEGTGLGLSTVYNIVKQHGGMITVDSRPGSGTTFDVYLPVHAGNAVVRPTGGDDTTGGTERILVVDDEPLLAELMARILRPLGYTVTTECEAEKALMRIREQPDAFDLVVTDQTMPRMTGLVLAEQIGHINRALPVILASGNVATAAIRDVPNVHNVLAKPYNANSVAQIVRQSLDETARQPAH